MLRKLVFISLTNYLFLELRIEEKYIFFSDRYFSTQNKIIIVCPFKIFPLKRFSALEN